jgi:hypothetical protein
MGSSAKHRTEVACQAEHITEVPTVQILRIEEGWADTFPKPVKGRVADQPAGTMDWVKSRFNE